MSLLGIMLQSGCSRHRKFISGYAEGHDMLYKHDSLGKKKFPSALSQHLLKESAGVLHDPFLLMLHIDTLLCVFTHRWRQGKLSLLANQIVNV